MKIRSLKLEDIDRLKVIHERDFPDLDFPSFKHLLSAFVIEDENNEIIMGGGVEAFAEALLVTNKEQSRIKVGKALVEAQRFAMFTCGRYNIRELYAFTTNNNYAEHLIQHGFYEREEKVLRMKLYG